MRLESNPCNMISVWLIWSVLFTKFTDQHFILPYLPYRYCHPSCTKPRSLPYKGIEGLAFHRRPLTSRYKVLKVTRHESILSFQQATVIQSPLVASGPLPKIFTLLRQARSALPPSSFPPEPPQPWRGHKELTEWWRLDTRLSTAEWGERVIWPR